MKVSSGAKKLIKEIQSYKYKPEKNKIHANMCHALLSNFQKKKFSEKRIKKIEQKAGLPAGHIAEILYQTIKKGRYTFDGLLKAMEKMIK